MTSCVTEQPVNHEMTRRKTLALHRYYTRRVCSSGICCVLDDQKHRRTHTVYIIQCTSRSGASSTFLALLPPVHIFRWYLHIPVSAEPNARSDGVKSHKLIPMPIVVLETF